MCATENVLIVPKKSLPNTFSCYDRKLDYTRIGCRRVKLKPLVNNCYLSAERISKKKTFLTRETLWANKSFTNTLKREKIYV